MSDSRAGNESGRCVRWARAFPELGTDPIPTDRCLSPEYFALERERVFKRVWLKVGRVEEIPNPRRRSDRLSSLRLVVRSPGIRDGSWRKGDHRSEQKRGAGISALLITVAIARNL
jgi:hypothetical protein